MRIFVVALNFISLLSLFGCRAPETAFVSNSDGMIFRENPGIKETKVGFAPYNSRLKVLDKTGPEETLYGVKARWFKIEHDGKTGWMFSGFLRFENKPNESVGTTSNVNPKGAKNDSAEHPNESVGKPKEVNSCKAFFEVLRPLQKQAMNEYCAGTGNTTLGESCRKNMMYPNFRTVKWDCEHLCSHLGQQGRIEFLPCGNNCSVCIK